MESWMIPVGVFLSGVAAKFLLEFFIPEKGNSKNLLKKILIDGSMTAYVLFVMGSLANKILTSPWSEDQYVYFLFQAFLAVLFLAFLVVVDAMKVFVDTPTEDGEESIDSLERLNKAFLGD